jgi:hypothetical protein
MTNDELSAAKGATMDDLLVVPVQAACVPLGAILWDGAALYDVQGFVEEGVTARNRATRAVQAFRGEVHVVALRGEMP